MFQCIVMVDFENILLSVNIIPLQHNYDHMRTVLQDTRSIQHSHAILTIFVLQTLYPGIGNVNEASTS